MSIIKCAECHADISDKALFCPHCGFSNSTTKISTTNKKYRKLPNGFGTIKVLSGKRRKPYAVYPSANEKGYELNGSPVTRTAIGYYETYQQAYDALSAYNKNPYDVEAKYITFKEVYELFYKDKFENTKRTYSESMRKSMKSGFDKFAPIHDMPIQKIRTKDMQDLIDSCPNKHATLELMILVAKNVFEYASKHDIVFKDYAKYLKINIADDDEKGVPFTDKELSVLWDNKDCVEIQIALILVYTGMRVSELKNIEINVEEHYFKGGVKTKNGKNRIIPIHDCIYDFACAFDAKSYNVSSFRPKFNAKLEELGIRETNKGTLHTTHDCRHTFSWLADRYGVDSLAKHMIMGHSLGKDIEQNVYGHRTIEELKKEVNKIQICG